MNYFYHRDHHFYWHNHSFYHDFAYYPSHWHTYVVVVPPSESNPRPVYEGPTLDVSRVDKLKQSKWAIDRLVDELELVPEIQRNTDDYRFRVKQILDDYHYLIYAVYDHASRFGALHAEQTGPHRDPVYAKTVKDIWEASLKLLGDYEAEFPFDTAMRADSVTVLYSNLAEKSMVTEFAADNPEYQEIFGLIGSEIPE